MSIFDQTAFSAVLKEVYQPMIQVLVADKVPALKMFNVEKFQYEGSAVKYPLLVGRAQSFLAQGPLGVIPTPQNETDVQVTIGTKWMRGVISLSYAIMALSRSNRGSWARAQEQLMSRLVTNMADEENRMLSAGSGTGILALVDGAGSGTTSLSVDAPGGYASDAYGTRYIQPGMIIAIHNGTTITAIRSVSAVATESVTTGTLTLDSVVSSGQAPDNSYISRISTTSSTSLTDDSSYNNEPMGLEGIVDDGTNVATFQNVSRTTYPDMKSIVLSSSVLTLSLMQRMFDAIDQQSGEVINKLWSHHSVRRLYYGLIDANRTFMQTGKAGKFDLGMNETETTYNGISWEVDRDARLGVLMGLQMDHMVAYPNVEGEWADETGSVFTRVQSNRDAYEAMYRKSGNYGCYKPNTCGKITGLSETDAIERHVQ